MNETEIKMTEVYDRLNIAISSRGVLGSKLGEIVEPRFTCYSCMRPQTHCVCNLITPFVAHCNILILQHPHERKKYYSTAKLVTKAITNSRLLRGLEFLPGEIESTLSGQRSYLLFPSATAADCKAVYLDSESTVIVIDGTWSEAGKILNRNPFLRSLPCLTFRQELKSNYRIRKQPKDNYLSTIESIAHLLRLNAERPESTNNRSNLNYLLYDRLFEGFDQMVLKQLQYFPRMGGNFKKRQGIPRPDASRHSVLRQGVLREGAILENDM